MKLRTLMMMRSQTTPSRIRGWACHSTSSSESTIQSNMPMVCLVCSNCNRRCRLRRTFYHSCRPIEWQYKSRGAYDALFIAINEKQKDKDLDIDVYNLADSLSEAKFIQDESRSCLFDIDEKLGRWFSPSTLLTPRWLFQVLRSQEL